MNLDDGENRLALQKWVADLRASVKQFEDSAYRSLPMDPHEALARLQYESESNAPAIERAISHFSRTTQWPEDLSSSEYFYINLRVSAALQVVEGLLSGCLTNPGIIEVVGGDKVNFTEWMLSTAWKLFGEAYLRWFSVCQARWAEKRGS
jgi:hypothetical protein